MPCAVSLQFPWELLPHELIRGATPSWRLLHAHRSRLPAHRGQESAEARFVLRILAKKNDLDAPAHTSHPLATISESFRPELACEAIASLRDRTEMTPELSRLSSTPASPPR